VTGHQQNQDVDRQPGYAPVAVGGDRQADAHPVGSALRIQGRHRLHHRLANGPRHLGLGGGHVELGEQVAPPVEAAELDGGAADVDAEEFGADGFSSGGDNGEQDGGGERRPGTSTAVGKPGAKTRCPPAEINA